LAKTYDYPAKKKEKNDEKKELRAQLDTTTNSLSPPERGEGRGAGI
jgi:hypothetical protein